MVYKIILTEQHYSDIHKKIYFILFKSNKYFLNDTSGNRSNIHEDAFARSVMYAQEKDF